MEVFEWVGFIVGEILGDSSFFISVIHREKIVPQQRNRQDYVMFPFASILFSIMALAIMESTQQLLRGIYRMLVPYISHLSELKEMAEIILDTDPTGYTASVAVYMCIYTKIRNRHQQFILEMGRKRNLDLSSRIGIYRKDEVSGEWDISDAWRGVGKGLFVVVLIDMILLAIFHSEKLGHPINNLLRFEILEFLPLLIITVLVEAVYYLQGNDKKRWKWLEYKKMVNKKFDLILLKSAWIKLKQDHSMSMTSEMNENKNIQNTWKEESWEQYREEPDERIQLLVSYLQKKYTKYKWHDGYIDTAYRLIKGENVYLATPFYRDIGIGLFFPIYMTLLNNGKALILVQDSGDLEQVAQWIKEGIEEIHGLMDFWSIEVLAEINNDIDVGILPYQYIGKGEELEWQKDFFSKVSFVAILEVSDLLAGGQILASMIIDLIGKATETCTWFLCDKNTEGVLDLFSSLVKGEFVYVSATPKAAEKSEVFYWDVETEPTAVWNPVQRYLGIEAGIVEIAGKNNLSGPIIWYGENCMPVKDLKWIWGQYYEEYGRRIGRKVSQQELNEFVKYEISGNSCMQNENVVLLVEDEIFNLYEMRRQYITRGCNIVALHIMSTNYMLRNYMKHIENVMKSDAKYISAFIPQHVNSERNIALHLVQRMLNREVSEREIEELFADFDEKVEIQVIGIEKIQELIVLVLNVENAEIIVRYQMEFSDRLKGLTYQRYYSCTDERVRITYRQYFSQAGYLDESGKVRNISHLTLAGHLDQKYQRGQYIVLEGKYYEVTGKTMTDVGQSLIVKRASDYLHGRKYYRQKRKYVIEEKKNIASAGLIYENEILTLNRCQGNIKAYTCGYVEMRNWNDIYHGKHINWEEKEYKNNVRKYQKKQFLYIEAKEGSDVEIYTGLAMVISEMFCTFYPQHYHLLASAISINSNANEKIEEKILNTVLARVELEKEEKNKPYFCIIEDSQEDMGLLLSIEKNFHRILEIAAKYLEWSNQEGDKYMEYGRE